MQAQILENTIWVVDASEKSPELGMYFGSHGNFRGCVWLDEERLQTDFGSWNLDDSDLTIDLTGEGPINYVVVDQTPTNLNLEIFDSEISMYSVTQESQNRCIPVLQTWNRLTGGEKR